MAFDLGGLLKQYMGGGAVPADNAADHFGQAAQTAPSELVSQGLAQAFRSDQTPPFGEMVGQLFANANPPQQAGMLTQLLGSLSPAAIAALTDSGALSGVLGQGTASAPGPVSPQQASQVTPEQVQEIATHAEQHSPGIIDKMSDFYAAHTGLVQTLGSAALAIALAHMANRTRS
ncbi:MAG: hypothetical protein ABI886_03340 [Betaproteobacteria bacterium]